MKIIKHIILATLILGVYTNLFATDYYPIVAIHGIQNGATAEEGWPDWNNVNSAIMKIWKETYRGYDWGLTVTGEIADTCWANTELQPMPDTRRIYNFSLHGIINCITLNSAT